LDRLAALAGIEASYWDILGTLHETTTGAKRRILAAMDFDVGSPSSISATAKALADDPWRRWLGPVQVTRRGDGPVSVPLCLPAPATPRTLRWELILEDGGRAIGDVRPEELPRDGGREIDGVAVERLHLVLPEPIPEGYHRLRINDGSEGAETLLIVAPPCVFRPPWLERGERKWGWACQLYALRSDRNWGIGDFSDLAALAAAAPGASTIGINPLHALFPGKPEDASPYAPSSRSFLNPLYIDVTAIKDFATCEEAQDLAGAPEFAQELAQARDAPLVDYPRVSTLKMAVLERLHACFEARHPASADADPGRHAFNAFRNRGGAALHHYALFEALQEHFPDRPWPAWPQGYRRPDSPEVSAFGRDYARRVDFFAYLQWQADRQLAAAARCCAETGMAVGLYRDLAVGSHLDGADAWAEPDLYVRGASFGAPPDDFNAQGQDWGVPPLHPLRLRERAYAAFIHMLRANMAHAGALRIDHAMALRHLYWITPGEKAAAGAYVRYPFEDLLGILALESARNGCLIVGEDLGTVPEGFRERMASQGVLSYRVLLFERHDDGLFRRPSAYPALALATAGTHDMPSIRGHWEGRDLRTRVELGMFPLPESRDAAAADRAADKEMLLAALQDQGLLPSGFAAKGDVGNAELLQLIEAVERYLARTPSHLMMINLDDALREADQANIPGTVREYPNWRRKASLTLEALAEEPFVQALARAVAAERGAPRAGSG
jgi:4-alpha-glucanotransferase